MLDIKYIRENIEKVKKNTTERGKDPENVDKLIEIDEKRRKVQGELDQMNARKNEIADMLKDPAKRSDELKNEARTIREKSEETEKQLEEVTKEWQEAITKVPNMHFEDVPIGKGEAENVEERVIGEKPNFDFEVKDHLDLGNALNTLDFDRGAKVAGSQFYYLQDDFVLLEYALMMYGMRFLQDKGFKLMITPDLAKSRFYLGTGYDPRGAEAQIYEIDDEDLGLIATAEVTMAGYFADEVLKEEELPLKYAAITHCFRKEAGAYGKYSKGLYRVHQFTKLEMFAYTTPSQSEEMHQFFVKMEEEITQSLGIPYRVVQMCSGDLGSMAARKYDLEAWMPGRNEYGEITSTSNCTDYQARNLNIRYKDGEGKINFVHMLNGTALTSTRFPIAIIENYQQKDGTIKVPDVLVPFVGKEYIKKLS